MSLDFNERPAASGTADSLCIFLHGYGADGNDLLGLAEPMADRLPTTAFVAPNAPYTCTVNPMGFEWFPIPWIDGSDPVLAGRTMFEAFDMLNDWVAATCARYDLPLGRTALVGFSQGTMMSLHVGPRQEQALAGIVGFSGRLLEPERLPEIKTKPPVQLIHGDRDDVVPYTDMAAAAQALSAAGFAVEQHTSNGTAHGIAPDGLAQSVAFLERVFAGQS